MTACCDILTRVRDPLTSAAGGGIDHCVLEFIRISGTLLPNRAFVRVMPSCSMMVARFPACRCGRSCWPDPACLADNAAAGCAQARRH